MQISLKCSTYLKSNDPIIENIAVPNVTDNVLKSAYAGMVLRQVASHAFRRNCQDVIFLQRKLSLNIDRLASKEHKVIEFSAKKGQNCQKACPNTYFTNCLKTALKWPQNHL